MFAVVAGGLLRSMGLHFDRNELAATKVGIRSCGFKSHDSTLRVVVSVRF
jgi:hypothetical protein